MVEGDLKIMIIARRPWMPPILYCKLEPTTQAADRRAAISIFVRSLETSTTSGTSTRGMKYIPKYFWTSDKPSTGYTKWESWKVERCVE